MNPATSKISSVEKYLPAGACTVIQSDLAPVGGIALWCKSARLAETPGIGIEWDWKQIERPEWFKPFAVN